MSWSERVTKRESSAVDSWISGHAARLRTTNLEPASDTDAARIDALLAQSDHARVIVLGELSHWISEKSDFRLWWLRRLAARHPLVLAEELGHSDGCRVARYLHTGDEDWLDRVPTFGWEGDRREDRDDRPTGILRRSFDAYPTARFKAAQCAFYRELRALGITAYHGIDINAVAGAGYADARAFLPALPADLARRIEPALAPVQGESALDESARLTALQAEIESHRAHSDAAAARALDSMAFDVERMADTLRYQALAHPAPDYDALRPAMALREATMKRAVDRILDGMAADERLVLMAHALHLVKDDDRVDAAAGAGPGGNLVRSLGHHLARERGERVFAVWFVFGGGSDCQPFPDLPNRYRFPSDTLNARLLAAGGPLVVPTGAAADRALEGPVGIGHLYNLVARVELGAQTDAVFFLPDVTPLPA